MKNLRKTINHIPLLTPARGNAFERGIGAARAENGQHPLKHLLHERIVFSFLAYRSRKKLGATAREITHETGLHPKTVKNTLINLSDLAHEHGGRWFANEPPDGWFSTIAAQKVEHWSQNYAYTWLFLPRKGATFPSGDKNCRFSMNHAVVYSFLHSWANEKQMVYNLTILGLATMLHMNRKTVASLLEDLYSIGLAERHDLGQPLVIRLLPMRDEHLELFSPLSRSPEVEQVQSASPARPKSNSYQFKQDGFDEYRRLCKTFMSQSYAERAIRAARVLGWDTDDFSIKLEIAKNESDENVRQGKCIYENFGKFFVAPLEKRAKAIKEHEQKEEAEQRQQAYLASPEGQKAKEEQQRAINANPLHKSHCIDDKSLTDRVHFNENPIKNYQGAKAMLRKVGDHCSAYIASKGWLHQKEVDERRHLQGNVMKHSLSRINQHYQQPILATPEELGTAIDEVIAKFEPAMAPLFSDAPEVAHAE